LALATDSLALWVRTAERKSVSVPLHVPQPRSSAPKLKGKPVGERCSGVK